MIERQSITVHKRKPNDNKVTCFHTDKSFIEPLNSHNPSDLRANKPPAGLFNPPPPQRGRPPRHQAPKQTKDGDPKTYDKGCRRIVGRRRLTASTGTLILQEAASSDFVSQAAANLAGPCR